jgi:glycogen synthase
MRVLQLGPYPPPHGGVQSNLAAIHAFLQKQGIPSLVINITHHRKGEENGVYYPRNALELLRLLLRLRYDIIHLHVGGMLSRRLLRLGLLCSCIPGTKSVLTFHSGGYPSTPEAKATGRNSLASFVLRRQNFLIGVNPEIMSFFRRLDVPEERTRLVYPHAFPSDEELPGTLPEPLGTFWSAHRPVLITVGLLEPEYDLPLQIEFLGEMRQSFPSAGLVIIGSGSLEPALRRTIEAQPWRDHVLLCGDMPHAVTMLAIRRASAMLRTTFYDGDAVSVREALHLGTPVLATDNGMRPPGVHLIAKADRKGLLPAVEKVLRIPINPERECPAADERNLEAVLEIYEKLLDE